MDFATIKQKEVRKRRTYWSEITPPNCIRGYTPTTLLTDLGAYWRLKGRKTDCQHALLTSEPLFNQKRAFKWGEGRVKLLYNFKVFFSSLKLLCKICLTIQIGLFSFFYLGHKNNKALRGFFFSFFKRSMFHAPTGGVSHDDDARRARPSFIHTLCWFHHLPLTPARRSLFSHSFPKDGLFLFSKPALAEVAPCFSCSNSRLCSAVFALQEFPMFTAPDGE